MAASNSVSSACCRAFIARSALAPSGTKTGCGAWADRMLAPGQGAASPATRTNATEAMRRRRRSAITGRLLGVLGVGTDSITRSWRITILLAGAGEKNGITVDRISLMALPQQDRGRGLARRPPSWRRIGTLLSPVVDGSFGKEVASDAASRRTGERRGGGGGGAW